VHRLDDAERIAKLRSQRDLAARTVGHRGYADAITSNQKLGAIQEGFGDTIAKLPCPPNLSATPIIVGTTGNGNISVSFDPSLGAQGRSLAAQMLNVVVSPYVNCEAYFGVTGGQVNVVIASRSTLNDGSGGGCHVASEFGSGTDLYLDATFDNANVLHNPLFPLFLELGIYVAELSELFMGAQGAGWGEASSNGEALSRFCAERETPANTMSTGPSFVTAPAWSAAGFPDFINTTEPTDQDDVSIGCGIVYLYFMHALGFTVPEIVQAGGATLAANYDGVSGSHDLH
jgi:hypothetical protein